MAEHIFKMAAKTMQDGCSIKTREVNRFFFFYYTRNYFLGWKRFEECDQMEISCRIQNVYFDKNPLNTFLFLQNDQK